MIKDGLARADDLPLVLAIAVGPGVPRGAQVRLRLGTIDLMTLDLSATVLERLDSPEQTGESGDGKEGGSAAQGTGEEEEDLVGPITIAFDVLDTPDPT